MMREGREEDLLEMLREAIGAREAVPARLVATAKGSFAWHNIDAELAQLTYDSVVDFEPAAVRSETASIRALTFTSEELYLELEVTGNSLIGQVMPPLAGHVETESESGPTATVPIDELGSFTIEPMPAVPCRLHFRLQDQADVVTGWVAL
ncbi:MAG: hypothetical protein LBV34_25870 [Nocardiopsaceae bacterium]|nr:hypothetical protein [Nocardiopsaceae bacterium]